MTTEIESKEKSILYISNTSDEPFFEVAFATSRSLGNEESQMLYRHLNYTYQRYFQKGLGNVLPVTLNDSEFIDFQQRRYDAMMNSIQEDLRKEGGAYDSA